MVDSACPNTWVGYFSQCKYKPSHCTVCKNIHPFIHRFKLRIWNTLVEAFIMNTQLLERRGMKWSIISLFVCQGSNLSHEARVDRASLMCTRERCVSVTVTSSLEGNQFRRKKIERDKDSQNEFRHTVGTGKILFVLFGRVTNQCGYFFTVLCHH